MRDTKKSENTTTRVLGKLINEDDGYLVIILKFLVIFFVLFLLLEFTINGYIGYVNNTEENRNLAITAVEDKFEEVYDLEIIDTKSAFKGLFYCTDYDSRRANSFISYTIKAKNRRTGQENRFETCVSNNEARVKLLNRAIYR